jgi:hypothetical protein
MRQFGAAFALVLCALPLDRGRALAETGAPAPPAFETELFSGAELLAGKSMTEAQCATLPGAAWVVVDRRGACVRYYHSTAGGSGREALISLERRLRETMAFLAGASTLWVEAGRTPASVGAPSASSLTPTASRPCLVMRSAMGPASASRRQASSEPLARTSSSSPARMSLSTAFGTASSVTFAGRLTPRSLRREAEDRMTTWVLVSLDIGILRCIGAASLAATTAAPPRPCSRRGRIPRRYRARNGHTTALFAGKCQSFLDNLITVLRQIGSRNNRCGSSYRFTRKRAVLAPAMRPMHGPAMPGQRPRGSGHRSALRRRPAYEAGRYMEVIR